MLVIKKDKSMTYITGNEYVYSKKEIAAAKKLVPRITQNKKIPFAKWQRIYAKQIDEIIDSIETLTNNIKLSGYNVFIRYEQLQNDCVDLLYKNFDHSRRL